MKCFLLRLYQFTFPPRVYKGFLFSISSSKFAVFSLFDNSQSKRCKMLSHCIVSNFISLTSVMRIPFTYLLAICMSSLGKCLFKSFTYFLIGYLIYFIIELFEFLIYFEYVCAQSYLTLCNSIDYSPSGYSLHGIFQAKTWAVAISFSRVSSWSKDQTCISCIGR